MKMISLLLFGALIVSASTFRIDAVGKSDKEAANVKSRDLQNREVVFAASENLLRKNRLKDEGLKGHGRVLSLRAVDLSQGEAGATSVLNQNPKFVAANAFKRAFFKSRNDRSYPWISSSTPATVYIKLPNAVNVSDFSFRSRPEPIPPYSDWILKFPPRKFEFVGSNDCEKWTTIFRVESTTWTTFDQEKIWEVPEEKRKLFPCIGFKVLANGRTNQAAIQDAKFWENPRNDDTTGFQYNECKDDKFRDFYCLNGGTCVETMNGAVHCHCAKRWMGRRCDERLFHPNLIMRAEKFRDDGHVMTERDCLAHQSKCTKDDKCCEGECRFPWNYCEKITP